MKGVDISHYQKGLAIQQVRDSGNEFAIIKLTEGTWLVDSAAFDFYRNAYEIGFPVGCYCYSHAVTSEDAWAEAAFLLKTINRFPMPCGIFLDVEEPKMLELPRDQLKAVVLAWCDAIRNAGYTPGVYGSEYNIWAKLRPDELPADVLVWVAHYGKAPDVACDLWQSSDSGRVEGYSGPVDTDEVRSSRFKEIVAAGMPKKGEAAKDTNVPGSFAADNHIGDNAEMVGDACPIGEPCELPDISGALALLAGYLQTQEFQNNFLKYIEEETKNECS